MRLDNGVGKIAGLITQSVEAQRQEILSRLIDCDNYEERKKMGKLVRSMMQKDLLGGGSNEF